MNHSGAAIDEVITAAMKPESSYLTFDLFCLEQLFFLSLRCPLTTILYI